jgi:hypothetical protein
MNVCLLLLVVVVVVVVVLLLLVLLMLLLLHRNQFLRRACHFIREPLCVCVRACVSVSVCDYKSQNEATKARSGLWCHIK